MKLYFTFLLLLLSIIVSGETNRFINDGNTTISVRLEPQSMMRLRYYDDFLVQRVLEFRNASAVEAIVSKKIYINHIAEFKYDVFDGTTNKLYYNLFYVARGDKVDLVLQDFKLKNAGKNDKLFVNDFLETNESVFNMSGAQNKLENQININRNILTSNQKKIDSLLQKKEITDSIAALWREVAHNFYYLKLSKLNIENKNPLFDTLTNDLKQALLKNTDLNSGFLNVAIHKVASYNQIKNNLSYSLKSFIEAITRINTEKRYKAGVAYQALNEFPEKGADIYLESYELFKSALSDSAFIKQDYAARIIPNQKAFDKEIIKLVDANGVMLTLNEVFKKNRGKVLVFDLWASWCVPCIQEFPSLEKTKAKFVGKNIVFVGISLDKDSKAKSWKEVMLSSKIGKKNQYRVVEKSNKLISGLYKIETIPRYLIFDKKGMLVNDRFFKPSDPNFEKELDRYSETL